jgi:predicted glycoside hydrolase/deacetylase ChbG (UPF0249 family)
MGGADHGAAGPIRPPTRTGSGAPRRVIINADDLGLSTRVNDAVFDLMTRGRISSATMLVNAPGFRDAVERLEAFPRCSFGIHLNVTEFAPVTASPGLSPLLRDGSFQSDLPRQTRHTPALRRAVTEEWAAQVQALIDAGHTPSHLDSHHHCHTIPWLLPALREVIRRHSVRAVRRSLDLYEPEVRPSVSLRLKKAAWHGVLSIGLPITTTTRFSSFATFVRTAREGRLPAFESIELMCHPGHPGFEDETRLLESDWTSSLPFPVELVSYKDL